MKGIYNVISYAIMLSLGLLVFSLIYNYSKIEGEGIIKELEELEGKELCLLLKIVNEGKIEGYFAGKELKGDKNKLIIKGNKDFICFLNKNVSGSCKGECEFIIKQRSLVLRST